MNNLSSLSRASAMHGHQTGASTGQRGAQVLAAPSSHSAEIEKTEKIPSRSVHSAIKKSGQTIAGLENRAAAREKQFSAAMQGNSLKTARKMLPHAEFIEKRHAEVLQEVQTLIHDKIARAKAGVIPTFQTEFRTSVKKAKEAQEKVYAWQATVSLLKGRMAQQDYTKKCESPIHGMGAEALARAGEEQIRLGRKACEHYAQADELLSLVPPHSPVPIPALLAPFPALKIATANALRCEILHDLCYLYLDLQDKLVLMKNQAAMEINALDETVDKAGASGVFSQAQLDEMRMAVVDLDEPFVRHTDSLRSVLSATLQHADTLTSIVPITADVFKKQAEAFKEFASLKSMGATFRAEAEPYVLSTHHDRFGTLYLSLQMLLLDGASSELARHLENVTDSLGNLSTMFDEYLRVVNGIACIEEPDSELTKQIMQEYGWDQGEELPGEEERTPDHRFRLLHPLPQHVEDGAEQLLTIATAIEGEFCNVKTVNRVADHLRDIARTMSDFAPAMHQAMDNLIAEGADPAQRDESYEAMVADLVNWHGADDEGYMSGSEAESDSDPLAEDIAQLHIDGPARTEAQAPAVTSMQKELALGVVKECKRKADDLEKDGGMIESALVDNLRRWRNRRLDASGIREIARHQPTMVESQMHTAANRLKTAAEELKKLARGLERQGGKQALDEAKKHMEQAAELLDKAAVLRAEGTSRCLVLIAQMPTEKDLHYLVRNRHIEGVDRPTTFGIVYRNRKNEIELGEDGQPQRWYGHEYVIRLRGGLSFVAHFKYDHADATPVLTPCNDAILKTSAQARDGYQSQRLAAEQRRFVQIIWREPINPRASLTMLQSFLSPDNRIPLPEVARPLPRTH